MCLIICFVISVLFVLYGPGYDGSDLSEILKEIEGSLLVHMDRWSVQVIPDNPQDVGDLVPFEIINNYFSIGVVRHDVCERSFGPICTMNVFIIPSSLNWDFAKRTRLIIH